MDRMTMNDTMDEVFNRRHAPRQLDDSERNQLADLAGEGDENCAVCDEPVRPVLSGGLHNITSEFPWTINDEPVHEECYDDEKERWAEHRAEARADRALGRGPGR